MPGFGVTSIDVIVRIGTDPDTDTPRMPGFGVTSIDGTSQRLSNFLYSMSLHQVNQYFNFSSNFLFVFIRADISPNSVELERATEFK